MLFHNNKIFESWNKNNEKTHLIKYILPTEDLEDLNQIKKNYENIEQYDFDEVISKYGLKDSIISLFFKGEDKVRVLTRITYNKNVVLKNQSFPQKNFSDIDQIEELIKVLKTVYEDHWKKLIKLTLQ